MILYYTICVAMTSLMFTLYAGSREAYIIGGLRALTRLNVALLLIKLTFQQLVNCFNFNLRAVDHCC
jgi:hypothetical protein